jgi:hypothetical protein
MCFHMVARFSGAFVEIFAIDSKEEYTAHLFPFSAYKTLCWLDLLAHFFFFFLLYLLFAACSQSPVYTKTVLHWTRYTV